MWLRRIYIIKVPDMVLHHRRNVVSEQRADEKTDKHIRVLIYRSAVRAGILKVLYSCSLSRRYNWCNNVSNNAVTTL